MLDSSPFIFYLVLGVALLAAELLIFQLSVFWLLFIGIGALVASLVAWFIPEASWFLTTTVFVVASIFISVLLYKPLKKWQNKPGVIAGNDAIGQSVKVVAAIHSENDGKVSWSGVDWLAELAEGSPSLEAGDTALIDSVKGIKLRVKKKGS